MKAFITCFLLVALLGIVFAASFAQQNQTSQKSNQDIETPEERISVLESKLQTVENVEKMELAAKLADANAKLANTEFNKFKNELRESNNQWLKSWSTWFLTIIGIFAAILIGVSYVFWYWLRSRTDQLITNSVEKHLNGFKEAVEQLNVLKSQLDVLEKEHASSVLENFVHSYIGDEHSHPEQIKALREEVLLQEFSDEKRPLIVRLKAAEVLSARKSTRLVSPTLDFLNSIVDSDLDTDWNTIIDIEHTLNRLVNFVGGIHTDETCQGLKKFLNRLLTENPKHKELFLTRTVFSLAWVSIKLNSGDSVYVLRMAIPHLKVGQHYSPTLQNLARYFDIFNEPIGIREILKNGLTDGIPEVETRCLELLQKHDPEFVEKWKAEKATANPEIEESE